MAVPADFDESNLVLNPPPGVSLDDCSVLNVMVAKISDGNDVIVSCWKLTKEELEEINKTGRIWLTVFGRAMPPVAVNTIKWF